MSRTPIALFLLTILFAIPAAAQNADLTLKLTPDSLYNAGETGTVKATVTNLGPDTATAVGVRLTKPVPRFAGAPRFGCIESTSTVLCNTPTLGPGQSHDFLVPFSPPDVEGTFALSAATESFTVDPSHENDRATANAEVVRMTDLTLALSHDFSFRPATTSRVHLFVNSNATRRPDSVTAFVTFPESLVVKPYSPWCDRVEGAAERTYRCTFPNFGLNGPGSADFDVVPIRSGPPVTITASIAAPEPEWSLADNRVSLVEPVYDVYDLDIKIPSPPDSLDADNRVISEFLISNVSDSPASEVTAEIITYPGDADASAASNGWTCKPSDIYRLLCTIHSIAPHSTSALRLPVRFATHELRGEFRAEVIQKPTSAFRMQPQSVLVDVVFYRPFKVSSTADSGPGSLRQTILDANGTCSGDDAMPCSIRFEIVAPVPAEGWFTIAPATPLPRITVTDVLIDGDSQTALTGNTNLAGPEIFLAGGQAGDAAEGLDLNPASAAVRGLAIGGFAGNGIRSVTRHVNFVTRHQSIERNFIGTDPTGTVAIPNGLRGLTGDGFQGVITGNVISGNQRSGVFLTNNSFATIRDNRIGVAAASDDALGNGASGIYVGGRSSAVIEHNVIANGNDFGIALDRFSSTQVLENRIFNNAQPGIDIGLDGPSLDGAPQITSALVDSSTGETVVEGVLHDQPVPNYPTTATIYLYANTRDQAAGEIFLGAVEAGTNGQFTLRYQGNLTGKYIDAMKLRVTDFGDGIVRESSEFGPRLRM